MPHQAPLIALPFSSNTRSAHLAVHFLNGLFRYLGIIMCTAQRLGGFGFPEFKVWQRTIKMRPNAQVRNATEQSLQLLDSAFPYA